MGKDTRANTRSSYSIVGVIGELPSELGQALLDLIVHVRLFALSRSQTLIKQILQNEQNDNETIYRAAVALGNVVSHPMKNISSRYLYPVILPVIPKSPYSLPKAGEYTEISADSFPAVLVYLVWQSPSWEGPTR